MFHFLKVQIKLPQRITIQGQGAVLPVFARHFLDGLSFGDLMLVKVELRLQLSQNKWIRKKSNSKIRVK